MVNTVNLTPSHQNTQVGLNHPPDIRLAMTCEVHPDGFNVNRILTQQRIQLQ